MKTVFTAATSAFALAFAVPAMADDHGETAQAEEETHDHGGMMMNAAQMEVYRGWSAENRATFDAWPGEIKTYYFSLEEANQEAWWLLTDEQRVRLYNLEPAQRDAAWTGIMNQVGSMEEPEPAPTPPMRFVSNEVSQAAPAPKTEYPICEGDEQDGCINSYEATGTGNRPLEYWPGRPASEIEGQLPAEAPAAAAEEDADEE